MFNPELMKYCKKLENDFSNINPERKESLKNISGYIIDKINNQQSANLIFICTHNSRRSHFGQIWAHTAAFYYSIKNIHTFSGGTEATAFNINAINALKRVGFIIDT